MTHLRSTTGHLNSYVGHLKLYVGHLTAPRDRLVTVTSVGLTSDHLQMSQVNLGHLGHTLGQLGVP